mmetsp:Transcript_21839/g.31693  ORF Transcript_21839/g.31693 Transcript_21839/m.31693 type:complete len:389 (-) Transcript_21839:299-1465(-)|eukprot:CAMPEP_0113940350 /NCGR_PEP_ID=MMETSP1339-20121228/6499_1 /TAXON_ID=94617 /ORGANISM="Fibrocapsa japonica" /LENGTH=388 /DNA_ID=CAMNT_0000944153 /DNA_START=46 /DNA_END=1212 /DNA_ORIENTATION=+ /assembly_acc=CAM_ASM_000762
MDNTDPSAGMTEENEGSWDKNTQTFHGGQDWAHLDNFVCDFSVTTNALGTPAAALEAARKACDLIDHYPPSDFEPALTELAQFLWPKNEDAVTYKPLLQLGNGASELIDLVIRSGATLGKWRPGPQQTQYKEYSRSAIAAGFETTTHDDKEATLLCMVNPTNPTGDYMDCPTMMGYIEEQCQEGTTVIVDESMQPWLGPEWREDSLIKERDWAKKMAQEKKVYVWIMTSWTKIWSCTGVRLGSVVAPTEDHMAALKKKQVPWSVNWMALEFLKAVLKDEEYMKETWKTNNEWNAHTRETVSAAFPSWKVMGEPFLSWLWIDTGDEAVQQEAVALAKAGGVPVRSGTPGYNLPTYVRIAVRKPEHVSVLMQAWAPLAGANGSPAKKQKV